MANTIRIKRRASGESGAPSSLKNAELAFNEIDQKLYYGKGADGSGNATSIVAIGGVGWDSVSDLSNYGALNGTNTWSGANTFSSTLNVSGTLQLDGTSVTSTAAELNILDGVTASTAELNVLDGVTASTAELNILDGVTSTSSELNLVDGSSAGTVVNSKAVVYGAAGEVNATTLQIAGTSITSTAVELNLVDGSVAGTVVNSKAVVYGAAGEVNATTLQIAGSSITATAAELNVMDGITASTAELNILDGVTADFNELNLVDGAVANTVVNSKAVVYGAAGEVAASSIATTGAVTVGENLTVTGNLTVNGTTLTVNAETVEVEDKNIVLGKVETPTDATADGGGLTLKGATDKEFKWVDSTDAWTSSEHVALAAGKDLLMSGATSGKVTLVVPDVAGTNTITFPAETGTVVTSASVCSAISSCDLDGGSF
jgi:hypothetical protein